MPERLAMVGAGAAVAATVYPTLNRVTGLSLPCPLRTLSGVPCPACGMTTAATALARGDLTGAAAANPFIFVLAALTVAVLPLVAARGTGRMPVPAQWSAHARRRTGRVAGVLAGLSWAWQLHRFGWF